MSCAQGVATFVSCNKDKSIPFFSKHLEENSNDYYARYYRGRAYEIIQEYDKATADFKILMERSQDAERLVAQAKLIMLQRKDFRKAADFLKNIIAQYPRSVLACSVLGEILVDEDCFDEALPYLLEAVKIKHPLIGSAYRDLGWIYISRKDYEKAKQCFCDALEQHETMTHAHLGLAHALFGLGRHPEAKPHLARAAELNPYVYSCYVSSVFKIELDVNQGTAQKVGRTANNRKYFMPKFYNGQRNKDIWFVKDTARHAQCCYKVYIEKSDRLNFLYGADEFGKRIPKHESMDGTHIRLKDLNIKKNS